MCIVVDGRGGVADIKFGKGVFMETRVSKKQLPAFTLVELLVVIAIIALLLSILVPALGKARSSARTVICCTNAKQIGMAIALYGNEYGVYVRDTMPFDLKEWGNNLTNAYNNNRWYVTIARLGYLTRDGKSKSNRNFRIDALQNGNFRVAPVFTCPEMSNSINAFIVQTPDAKANVNQSSCTYAINGTTIPGEPFSQWVPQSYSQPHYEDQHTMWKVGRLRSPSNKIYLACADYRSVWWQNNPGSNGYFGSYLGGRAYNGPPWLVPYGHGGKNNGVLPGTTSRYVNEDGQVPTLLADFHVEKVNKKALIGNPDIVFDRGTSGLRWCE
jgi:prepilin-type N-terminal cleavage/methylation domain-containing protein